MKILLNFFFVQKSSCYLDCSPDIATKLAHQFIQSTTPLQSNQYFIRQNGETVDVHLKLCGGKGGFGSLLRGQPPKKQMTSNFDACRDLTGRRLRHTLQARRMQEWAQKKEEEEKRIEEQIKLTEERKNQLNKARAATQYKLDNQFFRKVERTDKRVAKAIKAGLQKAKKSQKQTERKMRILKLLLEQQQ